ncbi:MAG: hypothetical protein M1838_006216 [Thelocarpon superellum]|nr:MAG: hypothetical protein M1838_006216 [Thelocarpon superellum]
MSQRPQDKSTPPPALGKSNRDTTQRPSTRPTLASPRSVASSEIYSERELAEDLYSSSQPPMPTALAIREPNRQDQKRSSRGPHLQPSSGQPTTSSSSRDESERPRTRVTPRLLEPAAASRALSISSSSRNESERLKTTIAPRLLDPGAASRPSTFLTAQSAARSVAPNREKQVAVRPSDKLQPYVNDSQAGVNSSRQLEPSQARTMTNLPAVTVSRASTQTLRPSQTPRSNAASSPSLLRPTTAASSLRAGLTPSRAPTPPAQSQSARAITQAGTTPSQAPTLSVQPRSVRALIRVTRPTSIAPRLGTIADTEDDGVFETPAEAASFRSTAPPTIAGSHRPTLASGSASAQGSSRAPATASVHARSVAPELGEPVRARSTWYDPAQPPPIPDPLPGPHDNVLVYRIEDDTGRIYEYSVLAERADGGLTLLKEMDRWARHVRDPHFAPMMLQARALQSGLLRKIAHEDDTGYTYYDIENHNYDVAWACAQQGWKTLGIGVGADRGNFFMESFDPDVARRRGALGRAPDHTRQ